MTAFVTDAIFDGFQLAGDDFGINFFDVPAVVGEDKIDERQTHTFIRPESGVSMDDGADVDDNAVLIGGKDNGIGVFDQIAEFLPILQRFLKQGQRFVQFLFAGLAAGPLLIKGLLKIFDLPCFAVCCH